VSPNLIHGANVYTALGGYEGGTLPSSGYMGWGFLAVLATGTVVWWRDHYRMKFLRAMEVFGNRWLQDLRTGERR